MKIRSHYENLKVTRDAPPEVIRAAYRTLSQKYHPDRNPGNPDSARVMALLNVAFEILSDPSKRREHDRWIAESEKVSHQSTQTEKTTTARSPAYSTSEHAVKSGAARPSNPFQGSSADFVRKMREESEAKERDSQNQTNARAAGNNTLPRLSTAHLFAVTVNHFYNYWFLYLVGLVVISSISNNASRPVTTSANQQTRPSVPKTAPAVPIPRTPSVQTAKPIYVRPVLAPNGEAWPTIADYIDGFPFTRSDGLSVVTVDNTQNNTDVFVKLNFLDVSPPQTVRYFFIPALDKFTLGLLDAGRYDIRYKILETGRAYRSDPFTLEEFASNGGRRFTNLTMTLYKVRNGNMQTVEIAEDDF